MIFKLKCPYKSENDTPFLVFINNEIIDFSGSFLTLTEYSAAELLNKNVIELFTKLRIFPKLDLNNVNYDTEYFLFTKSLDVKSIRIVIHNKRKENIITFYIQPGIAERFPYVYHLYKFGSTGIAVFSAHDNILLAANDIYLTYLDPPFNKKENCIGKRIEDYIMGYAGSENEIIWSNLNKTNEPFYIKEFSYESENRGITYWDSSIVPIFEGGKIKYYVENTIDVTERVKNRNLMEEQNRLLRQQNEYLRIISENMNDALVIINKDGRYEFKNNKAKSLECENEIIHIYGDTTKSLDVKSIRIVIHNKRKENIITFYIHPGNCSWFNSLLSSSK